MTIHPLMDSQPTPVDNVDVLLAIDEEGNPAVCGTLLLHVGQQ
jgi:hypothetical protein